MCVGGGARVPQAGKQEEVTAERKVCSGREGSGSWGLREGKKRLLMPEHGSLPDRKRWTHLQLFSLREECHPREEACRPPTCPLHFSALGPLLSY